MNEPDTVAHPHGMRPWCPKGEKMDLFLPWVAEAYHADQP